MKNPDGTVSYVSGVDTVTSTTVVHDSEWHTVVVNTYGMTVDGNSYNRTIIGTRLTVPLTLGHYADNIIHSKARADIDRLSINDVSATKLFVSRQVKPQQLLTVNNNTICVCPTDVLSVYSIDGRLISTSQRGVIDTSKLPSSRYVVKTSSFAKIVNLFR